MTRFNHQPRSGRRKKPKDKPSARPPLGIGGDVDKLAEHRELEALRRPASRDRQKKALDAERLRERRATPDRHGDDAATVSPSYRDEQAGSPLPDTEEEQA